jgi:type II secretion system protein N
MTRSERQRRILRWLGYPLLALVVFSFTLQLTFPYDRVKDKLVELLSEKYDVQIASASPTLAPGGMVLESILLKSKPTRPDEQPTAIAVDRLRVDVGLVALLIGRINVGLVAEIGEGEIVGDITVSPTELAVEVGTEDLELENIPGLRDALGLPMKGGLDAELDVTLPEQRWDLAEGSFTLSCPGCVVGDGKSKIKPKQPSARGRTSFFAAEGLTVPALNLGDLEGKISIISGKGVIDHFGAKSVDGDLEIHGTVTFGRTFSESQFGQACMKFRLSDTLKQREAEFGNVPSLMGAPLDSEGFSNVIMSGKLSEMRWIAATSCQQGGQADRLDLRAMGQGGGSPSAGRGRPRLPTGEGDQAAPVIPGTDIPAAGAGDMRPAVIGEGGGVPGVTGTVPEPAEPVPDPTLEPAIEGAQRMGRGRLGNGDLRPDTAQPNGDPAPRGERPVDENGDIERREAEERAEREAEEVRREADRRAEEAEQPDGDEGEGQQNNERHGNEE